MERSTALIAGASGLIGRRIAEHLIAAGNWDVIGLARRPSAARNMRWIAVDLADIEDCRRKLGRHRARAPATGSAEHALDRG